MAKAQFAPQTSNILAPLPAVGTDEAVGVLLKGEGGRLECIVSHGQASPAGFWYDQDDAEWVLVVRGRAQLTIEGESEDRALGPGDSVLMHCRHRISWTDPHQPIVWLALFVDARLAPTPVV